MNIKRQVELLETDLRDNAKNGIKKISIVVNNDACESCKALSVRKIFVEDALKNHILPNGECTFKGSDDVPSGWCRCYYQADTNSIDLSSISIWSN
jgi:hypothetical protein